MKHKRLITLLGSICLTLILAALPFMAACPAPAPPEEEKPLPEEPIEEEPIEMVFAHERVPEHPWGVAADRLKQRVEEATNGKVIIKVYPAKQLYGSTEGVAAIQAGTIQLAYGGIHYFTTYEKSWECVFAPFILRDAAHFYRVLETDAGKALLERTEDKGLKILGWSGLPGYGMIWNNERPIEKLEDWEGLKIRCPPSEAITMAVKAFGASPISIPTPEVSTALEQGMVDGMITNPILAVPVFDAVHRTPYVTTCPIQAPMCCFITNKAFWESVPADLRAIMEPIFLEEGKRLEEVSLEYDAAQLEAFEEAEGTVVTYLTDAEEQRWLDAGKPVIDLLVSKYGPDLINAVLATR